MANREHEAITCFHETADEEERGMTPPRVCWIVLFVFCALIGSSRMSFAQVGDTGQIEGTVTDTTGAVLPGVAVTATADATNRTQTTVTNDAGRYTFPALTIGRYTIQAELSGFTTAVGHVSLRVQEVAVVDVALEVGQMSEQVEVTTTEPLLETTRGSQGQVIDSERIQQLPLNGRDYAQLALLSQGTVQPIGGRFGGFSAAGQRTTQNNYLLNGVDNNDMEIAAQGEQAEVVKPIVDAVEEFRVETNGYSAEFGRATGGVLNLKVKSGTNAFHGSLWEFLRNDALDARDFFNTHDQPQAPFKRNQFGGALGGPVLRDTLFFFNALEWQRRRESNTIVSNLPTAKMRQGDFSELSAPIFDPATFDPATGTRQPFRGNIIPADRIDPTARQLVDLVPGPQTSDLTRNVTFNSPQGFNEFKVDTRVDWNVRSRDHAAFTVDYSDRDQFPTPGFEGVLGGGQAFTFDGTVVSAQWNHTFSPNLVTTTKAAWNRRYTAITSATAAAGTNLASQVALAGVDQEIAGSPVFGMEGFRTLGGSNFNPNLAQSQNRQVVSDTTWITGNHQVQFGVNIQRLQSFLTNPQQQLGNFQFNGSFTRNPDGNAGGSAFADFLLGMPSTTTVSTNVFMNLRSWQHAAYVQDTWRPTPNLTLNLGLRYEVFLPWQDKQDGLANFDPDLSHAPQAELILAADGDSRVDRALIETDSNNFAPRIGLTYRLGANTVVRSGYGIFYGAFEETGGGQYLETNLPFKFSSQITTDGISPAFMLSEGVPAVLTPENVAAPVLSSFERDFAFPYSQQWNLNIQHTFARSWLVQVGYFGSATKHLSRRLDLNAPEPGPGNVNDRRPFTSVVFPGTDVVVSPLGGFNSHTFDGRATYHSGQVKLEKRFSRGFTILSSYIFSRTMSDVCAVDAASGNAPGCEVQDVRNLRAEKALDNQHRKHRFVASYVWELPFGRDRRFGSEWGGLLNALLGGWSTQGIITFTSGRPFSVTVGGDPANNGSFESVDRPNLVGDPTRPDGADPVDQFFDTAAFEVPAAFTFGNAGRNTLTGPSLNNGDLGLFKRFDLGGDVDAEFRFEAFNVTNTPHLGLPNAVLGTSSFGQISGTASPNRKLQFGLKVLF
ncbi:MAG: hypothetical protein GEV06_27605 [Luteitalea sp.]|nr:hypothetical protein [Luteitalea sp.]